MARIEAMVRRRARERPTRGRDDRRRRAGHPARPLRRLRRRQPLSLSRKEYELLVELAGADGRVLEREDIYQRVWGYTMARGDRSVDVFVRKLRQKLERVSPDWRYVHTHFGVGYRFAAERARRLRARAGGGGGWWRARGFVPAQPSRSPRAPHGVPADGRAPARPSQRPDHRRDCGDGGLPARRGDRRHAS